MSPKNISVAVIILLAIASAALAEPQSGAIGFGEVNIKSNILVNTPFDTMQKCQAQLTIERTAQEDQLKSEIAQRNENVHQAAILKKLGMSDEDIRQRGLIAHGSLPKVQTLNTCRLFKFSKRCLIEHNTQTCVAEWKPAK